jgi:hypothetical protein
MMKIEQLMPPRLTVAVAGATLAAGALANAVPVMAQESGPMPEPGQATPVPARAHVLDCMEAVNQFVDAGGPGTSLHVARSGRVRAGFHAQDVVSGYRPDCADVPTTVIERMNMRDAQTGKRLIWLPKPIVTDGRTDAIYKERFQAQRRLRCNQAVTMAIGHTVLSPFTDTVLRKTFRTTQTLGC